MEKCPDHPNSEILHTGDKLYYPMGFFVGEGFVKRSVTVDSPACLACFIEGRGYGESLLKNKLTYYEKEVEGD